MIHLYLKGSRRGLDLRKGFRGAAHSEVSDESHSHDLATTLSGAFGSRALSKVLHSLKHTLITDPREKVFM